MAIRDLEGQEVADPWLLGYWKRYWGITPDCTKEEMGGWRQCDRELRAEADGTANQPPEHG